VRGLALHLEAGARLGTRPLLKLLIPGDSDLEGEQQEACQRDLTPAGSSRGGRSEASGSIASISVRVASSGGPERVERLSPPSEFTG